MSRVHLAYVNGRWDLSGDSITVDDIEWIEIHASADTNYRPVATLGLMPGAIDVDLHDVDAASGAAFDRWMAAAIEDVDTERLAGEIRGGMSEDPVGAVLARLAEWARRGALR